MNQSELIYLNTYGQPESRNVYDYMGAKKTVQSALPIQPGFAQVAWTLLDPYGQA